MPAPVLDVEPDHLHLGVEALRNTVVSGESPHPGDLLPPGPKGLTQRLQSRERTGLQLLDASEQVRDQAPAVPLGSMLDPEQPGETLLEAVDGFQAGDA